MKFIDYLLTYTALKYKNQHIHTQTSGASLFLTIHGHGHELTIHKHTYITTFCTVTHTGLHHSQIQHKHNVSLSQF